MKKKIFTTMFILAATGGLAVPHCPYIFADVYEVEYGSYDSYDDAEDPGVEPETGEFSNEMQIYPDNNGDEPDPGSEIDPPDPVDPPEPGPSILLTSDDIEISPLSKGISVGSSFKIDILQADPDYWEDYDEDAWEEACEESIDSIEYRSKKSYVAKVSANGVVKGKHKGTTMITTTVYFKSGEKMIRKTKVRVRK